ncbi:MAG: aminopeptidase P family protein [Ignavibacteriaceae bacterium]|nr:aminopeptidase P family protein [Ignavibacteriaceae bacterium]
MDSPILREKIKQASELLSEKNIDVWMIYVRESADIHDPSLDVVVGSNHTWQSAFIIDRSGETTAIIGSLEEPSFKKRNLYDNVIGYVKSVKEPLLEYFNKRNPKSIALNYSVNSNLADGLTHGMYLNLLNYFQGTDFASRFISSEEIIRALRGRKSESELNNIREAIKHTQEIFAETTKFIAPGRTEQEIAAFMTARVKERGLELAWDPDHCPAVYAGPEVEGAHSGPTNRTVEKGHVLNIDYGVKVNGYCSDMQRTWYVLRDGETEAPAAVMHGFNTIKTSIRKASDAIKPGMKGFEIDTIARSHITSNGYAEFQHALGHQVGRNVHDGGVGLYPQWEKYGILPNLELEKGQVFTIEPRLKVEGHGTVTMEEMVVVTEDGCSYLSIPQEEIILIK